MILSPTNAPRQVLLIEHNSSDILSIQRAFREADPSIRSHVASDGIDAMAYLGRQGIHRRAPRPDLILLDLSLPKIDGREVLTRIKLNDNLKSIPTIILTASGAEADIVQCYQLQANVYLTKPAKIDVFDSLLNSVIEFWLITAKLPHSTKTDEV